jgi:two-component system response regulator
MDRPGGLKILLVEDNPDHATFTLHALADGDTRSRTYWVKNGEEALDFLHHRRQWADEAASPRPDLILLDINMPKVDGHAVLRHVKGDEILRSIPVIMLTTSDREEEVTATYRAGANSYVKKPVRFEQFMEKLSALKQYWMLTNLLPAA